MKKSISAFLFAMGVGLTFTAGAGTCEYHCIQTWKWCLNQAAGDMEKQAECNATQEECMINC